MIKKGGAKIDNILIQEDIYTSRLTTVYDNIITILKTKTNNEDNIKIMIEILTDLSNIQVDNSSDNFFSDIVKIVNRFNQHAVTDNNKMGFDINIPSENGKNNASLFSKYKLWTKETSQTFITIDPTIIQLMNFDNQNLEDINKDDIVYSLKLIIRSNGLLTLRYATNIFPNNSKITSFNDLTAFNEFNLNLGNAYIDSNYLKQQQLNNFLVKYINLYNFYKKCYRFQETTIDNKDEVKDIKSDKFLIDYQLKYISILGKARFKDPEIQVRCSLLTEYIMANLIFVSPSYAFISGGYKGFKDRAYGITRSGYEISKKYNRPIFTIMCNEGRTDSHQYSDAELIYGEHWGEDSVALSQFTDGAIIIAPFGGWTYVECLTLLANKKIIGIYNDFFNILNFENNNEIKRQNINFFKFNIMEQESILMYYINYYLILLYIFIKIDSRDLSDSEKVKILDNLNTIIIFFKYLKDIIREIINTIKDTNTIIKNIDNITIAYNLIDIINSINELKEDINGFVDENLDLINKYYNNLFVKCPDTYQTKIPKKCDGIWIKPIFNLMDCIIKVERKISTAPPETLLKQKSTSRLISSSTQPVISRQYSISKEKSSRLSKNKKLTVDDYLKNFTIDITKLDNNTIFKNLNNNIIFVFSDIMHLNIYLNHNLNSIIYQKQIHAKINGLMNISEIKTLIERETNTSFNLSRKLDGYLDTHKGVIELKDIDKKDYSFTIDHTCYNYSPLLTCSTPFNATGGAKKLKKNKKNKK
jgi:hypothetical protein